MRGPGPERRPALIQLVGPGGAGKSTAGALLARRLGVAFADLDEEFRRDAGDISKYLDVHGYEAYAERNVDVYLAVRARTRSRTVLALSSGFMTYPAGVHRDYAGCRQHVASSPSTFVLLPSLCFETCVAEIVRRQISRPFARSAEREELVIRARFATYADLPARKVETMRPVNEVVDELAAAAAPSLAGGRPRIGP
jgi:shikimate kinase